MRPRRPAGFGFFTACALLSACGCAYALALYEGPSVLPDRMALAVTGALALVTAEALAFVRPWAFTASVAFAGMFLAMIVVLGRGSAEAIGMCGPVGLFALVVLSIVRGGLVSVYGPQPILRSRAAP